MLKEKLTDDLKMAMKKTDRATVDVLRMLISAINNKAIGKRGQSGSDVLTDEEVTQVLLSEAKKRNDSIAMFEQGSRADLAGKEKAELEILKRYLPAQMGQEETEKAVNKIISEKGLKDFGSTMKEVMKELKGKADAKLISELIKRRLGD